MPALLAADNGLESLLRHAASPLAAKVQLGPEQQLKLRQLTIMSLAQQHKVRGPCAAAGPRLVACDTRRCPQSEGCSPVSTMLHAYQWPTALPLPQPLKC